MYMSDGDYALPSPLPPNSLSPSLSVSLALQSPLPAPTCDDYEDEPNIATHKQLQCTFDSNNRMLHIYRHDSFLFSSALKSFTLPATILAILLATYLAILLAITPSPPLCT